MNWPAEHVRLLIVEGDTATRRAACEALRSADCEVHESDSGAAGLAVAQLSRPDLIILAALMPELDGLEVCRRLRNSPDFQNIPIIMLTDRDDPAAINAAYDAGATEFVLKPLNPIVLTYRVRYAIRSSRTLAEADRQRARLERAQRAAGLGSWYWRRDPEVFDCSPAYRRMLGLAETSPLDTLAALLERVHPADRSRVSKAIDAARTFGVPCAMVYRMLVSDDAVMVIHEQIEVERDSTGQVFAIESTAQNISERMADQQRLRQPSQFDSLTGMVNRSQFIQAMRPVLAQVNRADARAALLAINVDRFVRVNETYGHATGDAVLQETANRIMDGMRRWDTRSIERNVSGYAMYARMGGDEFAVLLNGITQLEDALSLAHTIQAAIALPIDVAGQPVGLSACIGIALTDSPEKDAETLLRNADMALVEAKRSRAGTCSVYTEELNTATRATLSLEAEMRQALEQNEFLLYYQPRIDVVSGRLVGAEALIRWQHPQRGLVMPVDFIAIAEASGQIEAITDWVLAESCRQLAIWRDQGLSPVPVSVNFSSLSFRELGLSERILKFLEAHQLAPNQIEVEITESVMMQNMELATRSLQELRLLGIELAIDDFGTGFSSLNYLKRLPLSVLKIDRSFVQDVLTDRNDRAIAAAIIALGAAMGLRVVAEGVETVEQANFLLARGCHLMQRYLFSRPVPAAEFARALMLGFTLPVGLQSARKASTARPKAFTAATG